MEVTSISISRGMDKEDVIHIYNGILLSHKKNKSMPLAVTLVKLETVILSKISQMQKDRHHIISVICEI